MDTVVVGQMWQRYPFAEYGVTHENYQPQENDGLLALEVVDVGPHCTYEGEPAAKVEVSHPNDHGHTWTGFVTVDEILSCWTCIR
jgi:hypothetical protein